MGTSAITRRSVNFYVITKNKGEAVKFTKLPEARLYARDLHKLGNFKSLKNSNGTTLPI